MAEPHPSTELDQARSARAGRRGVDPDAAADRPRATATSRRRWAQPPPTSSSRRVSARHRLELPQEALLDTRPRQHDPTGKPNPLQTPPTSARVSSSSRASGLPWDSATMRSRDPLVEAPGDGGAEQRLGIASFQPPTRVRGVPASSLCRSGSRIAKRGRPTPRRDDARRTPRVWAERGPAIGRRRPDRERPAALPPRTAGEHGESDEEAVRGARPRSGRTPASASRCGPGRRREGPSMGAQSWCNPAKGAPSRTRLPRPARSDTRARARCGREQRRLADSASTPRTTAPRCDRPARARPAGPVSRTRSGAQPPRMCAVDCRTDPIPPDAYIRAAAGRRVGRSRPRGPIPHPRASAGHRLGVPRGDSLHTQNPEPTPIGSAEALVMRPTIVLVHGAFAESSSWDASSTALLDAGHPVIAAANPLRGLASDAAAVSDLVRSIDGPVVLVGHSYGGAVITNVDRRRRRDRRARLRRRLRARAGRELLRRCPRCSPAAPSATRCSRSRAATARPTCTSPRTASTSSSAPTCRPAQAARMAATQRPVTQEAARRAVGRAPALEGAARRGSCSASRTATSPRALEHYMAERARAHRTIEIPGASHAVSGRAPGATAELILEAAALRARRLSRGYRPEPPSGEPRRRLGRAASSGRPVRCGAVAGMRRPATPASLAVALPSDSWCVRRADPRRLRPASCLRVAGSAWSLPRPARQPAVAVLAVVVARPPLPAISAIVAAGSRLLTVSDARRAAVRALTCAPPVAAACPPCGRDPGRPPRVTCARAATASSSRSPPSSCSSTSSTSSRSRSSRT